LGIHEMKEEMRRMQESLKEQGAGNAEN